MSVTPGVTKTRTLSAANGISGGVGSTTQNPQTPLEYGRQVQSDGLSARGEA